MEYNLLTQQHSLCHHISSLLDYACKLTYLKPSEQVYAKEKNWPRIYCF